MSAVSQMGSQIECRKLGVGVAKGPRLATVDVQIQAGRFTAILGPNGAGKSTLMSMLVGERAPQAGQVLLDGVELASHPVERLARRRSVMPQDCSVAFDFTAQEVVELGRYPHRNQPGAEEAQIPAEAMALTGVDHLAQRSINTLSGGERARALFARALAVEAPALIADEPLASLDPGHQIDVMEMMRAEADAGALVIAVLHDLTMAARYCDRLLLLNEGRLVADGTPAEVLTPENLASVYGISAEVTLSGDWPTITTLGRVASGQAR